MGRVGLSLTWQCFAGSGFQGGAPVGNRYHRNLQGSPGSRSWVLSLRSLQSVVPKPRAGGVETALLPQKICVSLFKTSESYDTQKNRYFGRKRGRCEASGSARRSSLVGPCSGPIAARLLRRTRAVPAGAPRGRCLLLTYRFGMLIILSAMRFLSP